jgi:hypothetical protein
MANRFSQVSTSSFKPLSLDEIMAVPLAKQSQHDNAQLALDEFYSLESNSLDADSDYVNSQIDSYRRESDSLGEQLTSTGVDRNLLNKVKSLRNRKNEEFSIQGKTGQASAAYNQFKANEAAIMKRQDLTAAQKQAGLARAKTNYSGVLDGGKYEDYVGTAYIDVMQKGRDIAAQMTPQQVAKQLKFDYDEETGYYTTGTKSFKRLKPEHIQRVVRQALMNDESTGQYLREVEDLGLGNMQSMIDESAISAGNIYQVDDSSKTKQLLPQWAQGSVRTGGKDEFINPPQHWDSYMVQNTGDSYRKDLSENVEFIEDFEWNDDGNFDKDYSEIQGVLKEGEVKEEPSKWRDALGNVVLGPLWGAGKGISEGVDFVMGPSYNQKAYNMQMSVKKLRENDPKFNETNPATGKVWSDKDVYQIYANTVKASSASFSQVISATNLKNSYQVQGEDLIGTEKQLGTFRILDVVSPGIKGGTNEEMADNLGFSNIEDYYAAVTGGKFLGLAPGIIDYPGASAVSISTDDGEKILYFAPTEKIKAEFAPVDRMNKAKMSGQRFTEPVRYSSRDGQGYESVLTTLNPNTNSYDAYIIRGRQPLPEDAIDEVEWSAHYIDENGNPKINRTEAGTPVQKAVYEGNLYYKFSQQDETQRITNLVTSRYDRIEQK